MQKKQTLVNVILIIWLFFATTLLVINTENSKTIAYNNYYVEVNITTYQNKRVGEVRETLYAKKINFDKEDKVVYKHLDIIYHFKLNNATEYSELNIGQLIVYQIIENESYIYVIKANDVPVQYHKYLTKKVLKE